MTLAQSLRVGRHLLHVKQSGLADQIGGFGEWISLCGYTRQQADRLMKLAERTEVAGGSVN